ncbi:MAG TPA: hypothetical protein VEB00_08365 [Clostridia bacterium]|nr:hypothetical protein [Clostridia bacterium]
MTIRPVDLQTMIPKLPELQKARNIESEQEKSNLNINIHKEQQQQEKNTKQVIETKKAQGKKVDREGQQKEKQSGHEKERRDGQPGEKDVQLKESKGRSLTKIDIRI